MRTLRRGDQHPDVAVWQGVIGVGQDGKFGPFTEAATRAWQRNRGLDPDGVVGRASWTAASLPVPTDAGEAVTPRRTTVNFPTYADAVRDAHEGASLEMIAVLWSQYMIETGGKACWNWNIGNVKKVTGDGYDWHHLQGVWEVVTPERAAEFVASGQATYSTNPSHLKSAAPGRKVVVFQPPHPETRFRAYPSLDVAMRKHVEFLKRRYGAGWQSAEKGDVPGFAKALKQRGYYTASEASYAAGMMRHFREVTKR